MDLEAHKKRKNTLVGSRASGVRRKYGGERKRRNPIEIIDDTHSDDDDCSTAGHFSGEEDEDRKRKIKTQRQRQRQIDEKTMRKRAAVKEELKKSQQEREAINVDEEESICEATPPRRRRGKSHQANSLSRTFAETNGDPLEVATGQMEANGTGVAGNRKKCGKEMAKNFDALVRTGGLPKGSTQSKRRSCHAKAAESRRPKNRTAESRQNHPYSKEHHSDSPSPDNWNSRRKDTSTNEEEDDEGLDLSGAMQRYTGSSEDSVTQRRYSSDDLHDREVKLNDSSRRHSEFYHECSIIVQSH